MMYGCLSKRKSLDFRLRQELDGAHPLSPTSVGSQGSSTLKIALTEVDNTMKFFFLIYCFMYVIDVFDWKLIVLIDNKKINSANMLI